MKFVRILTIAILYSSHSASQTIQPPSPKAFEPIRLVVPSGGLGQDQDNLGDLWDPVNTSVAMVGNKITVSPLMHGNGGFQSLPTPAMDQSLGSLPPGSYEVEIIKRAEGRGSTGKVGQTLTLTVTPRIATAPVANYTDLWWVPSESGWGLGLFHHPSDQIFGTLFVYGSDGRPVWYVIPGGQFVTPTTFTGRLYRAMGPNYGGAFNPAQVSPVSAGDARISFDRFDSAKASLFFTIDGVTFEKQVQRQPF